MQITQTNQSELSKIITISIAQEDYQEKVDKQLKDYRKKANIPGFRKGMAPMSLIKKQYENALRFDEINKILQKELFDYLEKEKLEYLAQPVPMPKDDIDWNAQSVDFQFEIGLAPQFEVDLSQAEINHYNVKANEKSINEAIENLQYRNGEAEESETIEDKSFFTAEISEINTENPLFTNKTATIFVEGLKEKSQFIGKKVEDKITIKAQELYADVHQLQHALQISHEEAHHFNGELEISIKTIKTVQPKELNEDFYKMIFPSEETMTEENFKQKIKEELENSYKKDAEMFFLNEATDWLMNNISFELPSAFLVNYFQNSTENPLTEEEAKQEYEKSEKGIKYQLIENKIYKDNGIKLDYTELMEHVKSSIQNQLAMYGYKDISEEELNKFAVETMKNQETIKKHSDELLRGKLLQTLLEKTNKKEIETDYDGFIKVLDKKEGLA